MANIIEGDFPFEEIRKPSGDYFDSWSETRAAGHYDDQIWSITEGENGTICYGPPHHRVNLLGFIATKERHDGNTYYEERFDDEPSVLELEANLPDMPIDPRIHYKMQVCALQANWFQGYFERQFSHLSKPQ